MVVRDSGQAKTIHLQKDLPMIMDAKDWTKDRILFMSNVFFELDFVKIENNVMQLNKNLHRRILVSQACIRNG